MAAHKVWQTLARLPLALPRGHSSANSCKNFSTAAEASAASARPPVTFWPPLPGVPGMGPAPAAEAANSKSGGILNEWLITILGLPVVAGFYVYGSYQNWEHDNQIDAIYRRLWSDLQKAHHRNRAAA